MIPSQIPGVIGTLQKMRIGMTIAEINVHFMLLCRRAAPVTPYSSSRSCPPDLWGYACLDRDGLRVGESWLDLQHHHPPVHFPRLCRQPPNMTCRRPIVCGNFELETIHICYIDGPLPFESFCPAAVALLHPFRGETEFPHAST